MPTVKKNKGQTSHQLWVPPSCHGSSFRGSSQALQGTAAVFCAVWVQGWQGQNSAESGGLCTKNKQQDHPGGSKKAWWMLSICNHNNKHVFFWFGMTSTCKVPWLGDGWWLKSSRRRWWTWKVCQPFNYWLQNKDKIGLPICLLSTYTLAYDRMTQTPNIVASFWFNTRSGHSNAKFHYNHDEAEPGLTL